MTTVGTKTMRSRDWCFTMFADGERDIGTKYEMLKETECMYIVYQVEKCPESGREHIQGFVQMKNARLMKSMKTVLNDNTVHLEMRSGSVKQASDYCKKDESRNGEYSVVEIGDIQGLRQGQRNDIAEVYEMICAGSTSEEICEYNPGLHAKYYKWIEKCINDKMGRECGKFKQIQVEVMYGPGGTGKTSYIMAKHGAENVYKLEKGNNDNLWFDGYKGQKVLLIDDFYGWIKYGKMLNLLDGYKMMLEIKGGVTYSNWDFVYITSNDAVDKWYKQGLTGALNRRIDNVWNVKEAGIRYKENKLWKLTKKSISLCAEWRDVDEDDSANAAGAAPATEVAPAVDTEVAGSTVSNFYGEHNGEMSVETIVALCKMDFNVKQEMVGALDGYGKHIVYELDDDLSSEGVFMTIWVDNELLTSELMKKC